MDSFDFSLVVSMAVVIVTVCIITVAVTIVLIIARMCLVGAPISHTTFYEVHHSLSAEKPRYLVEVAVPL